LKAWGFDKSDGIGMEAALKAMRISWMLSIVFLLAWSLYEAYNARINYVSMNVIPGIWLVLQMTILGLAYFILRIKDKECPFTGLKAIRISWIFGTVFLFAWFFLSFREPIPILFPTLFLWVGIFEASRVILEDKMRKGTDKGEPIINPKGLNAMRVSWIFGILFLLVWSLYEVYNASINFVPASGIPMILLGMKIVVFGLSYFLIENDKALAIPISWLFGLGFILVYPIYSEHHMLLPDVGSMLAILGMQQISVYGLLYYVIPENKDAEGSFVPKSKISILTLAIILVAINIYVFYVILP